MGISQSFHSYDLVSSTNFNFMCLLWLYKVELKFVILFCSLMLILQLIYKSRKMDLRGGFPLVIKLSLSFIICCSFLCFSCGLTFLHDPTYWEGHTLNEVWYLFAKNGRKDLSSYFAFFSTIYSLLCIETADRPGLLVEIIKVIADINIDVESAEIDTEVCSPSLSLSLSFSLMIMFSCLISHLSSLISYLTGTGSQRQVSC